MTEVSGTEEKVCPFCAETIKAAAVKCRYCQSDLTGSDAAQQPREAADPPPPPPPPSRKAEPDEPDEAGQERRDRPVGRLGSFRLLKVLVAVCIVLAVIAGGAWWFYTDQRAEAKPSGPITSSQARDAGLQAATQLTEKVLSYDWKTLDKDTEAAKAVMGPSFRAEYAKAMAKVEDTTVKNQVKLEAKAVATSIVSASEHQVVALVFVNQVTTAKGTENQRLDQNRVLVTLTRADGSWRVSKMKAF